MLASLLFAAAVTIIPMAQQPVPANATPEERAAIADANLATAQALVAKIKTVDLRKSACPSSVITAETNPTSLFQGPTRTTQQPVWVPGANPNERRLPAVDTTVGGCRTPLTISDMRAAQPAPAVVPTQ